MKYSKWQQKYIDLTAPGDPHHCGIERRRLRWYEYPLIFIYGFINWR